MSQPPYPSEPGRPQGPFPTGPQPAGGYPAPYPAPPPPGAGYPGAPLQPWTPGPAVPVPGGAAGTGPVLVSLGDIACTQNEVITPAGRRPINAVVWTFTDMSQTTTAIPAWAIVVAILFFWFCLLGLLFLLVKETRTVGWVQVTVQGDRFLHQVQLPVTSLAQVADYNARVGYARSLSTAF